MSRHLERALGLADELPDEDLTIETYLGETSESLDTPLDNPVADAFSSNTEVDEYENPLDFGELAEPEMGPMDEFAPMSSPAPTPPPDDGQEEPMSDDVREALTAKFIENSRKRLLNSQKFQDRAELLNDNAEEDENAGL